MKAHEKETQTNIVRKLTAEHHTIAISPQNIVGSGQRQLSVHIPPPVFIPDSLHHENIFVHSIDSEMEMISYLKQAKNVGFFLAVYSNDNTTDSSQSIRSAAVGIQEKVESKPE